MKQVWGDQPKLCLTVQSNCEKSSIKNIYKEQKINKKSEKEKIKAQEKIKMQKYKSQEKEKRCKKNENISMKI